MPKAARVTDPIGHSPTMSWLMTGLLVGAALAVAAVAIVGTGGLAAAAIIGGAAAGGAGIGELLSTMSWAPKEICGLIVGAGTATDVFTNNLPAARAHLDLTSCSKHSGSPPIATGSDSVFINDQPAARVDDTIACSAVIVEGSPNVFIYGGTAQTDAIQPEDLVPGWIHAALFVVGGAAAVVLAGPIVATAGLAGGYAGGMAGGWLGGKIWGEGSDGQKWSMLGGSLLGGFVGAKGGGVAAKRISVASDRAAITKLSNQGRIEEARAILKPHVEKGDVRAVVDRLDVSTPKDRGYLWSGNKAEAGQIAAERGGMTLEQTPGGRVVDDWEYMNERLPWDQGGEQFWGGVSQKYAGQLSGDVTALQTPSRAATGGGYIFKNYEMAEVEAGLDSGRITSFKTEAILSDPPSNP